MSEKVQHFREIMEIRCSQFTQRTDTADFEPDFDIVSMETNDPSSKFKEFSTSMHPWAVKFRENAPKMFAVDFTGPTTTIK